jgi:hypothetical protein
MITFLNLGSKGNLGNQLFQIASTIGIAKTNNVEFCFPKWHYAKYFQAQFRLADSSRNWIKINEKQFGYYDWELENADYNLSGFLQSEKYFLNSNIKNIFKFEATFENQILQKYQHLFNKKTILVSVRRGDFVNNPNYFQLSYKYYLTALFQNFKNLSDYNIIFTSDKISYCKNHFSFLPNVFFLENLSPIEQLCLGSKFDNYVISNSTFSWWMAWLGEKNDSKIIRPIQLFDGDYAKINDETNYFPKRWLLHNEKDLKLSNDYFTLKIYGFLNIVSTKITYFFKSNSRKYKKLFKKAIKKSIGYQ